MPKDKENAPISDAGAEGTEPPQSAAPERGDAQPKSVVSKEIIDAGNNLAWAAMNAVQFKGEGHVQALKLYVDKWLAALSGLGEGMSDEYIEGIIDECFDDTQSVSVYAAARKALNHARDKGYLSRSVEEEPDGYMIQSKDWGKVVSSVKWSHDCIPLYRKVDAQ